MAVNDAPINTVPAAQTVDEDTTLPIAGVSVADSDSSALTTTLSVAHGILNVTAGPGVTVNGTASVTITGTAAQINTALAGLAYTGNLDFNGADTLTVATSDATATDTDTIAITVNPVNDAPINTVPGAQTVAEDTILPIAGVSVADIDSSALTTTLSVAHGILNVTAGAGVTGNGTASVTIAGTAAQINAALAGLAYTGNLDFNGADTLTVATSDATSTDTDTIAITVNPVNDTPVLNLDANSSTIGGVDYLTTFTGSAIAIVDTDVSILDTDSPSLVSATITLTNPHAGDSLTVDTPPLPGGIAASVYDPVTGVLTLTGTASRADYQAALQQIVFNTTDPSTETRIIDVVVNDGTAASNIAHAIVEVVEFNANAPTVDLDASTLPGTSYHTTFTENGTPVAIADTDTLIGDPDIGSTIASATIRLTNPQAGDLLTADPVALPLPGGITASAYNPVTGTLTLSGVASFTDYETALEAIRFSAAGDTPVAGNRIIQVTVNDGTFDSQPATSLVTVVAVNDAPINTVPAAQTVDEDTILAIAGVSVADIDSSALTTTLSVAHGILNVTAGPGVSGNGTASVTIAGTAAEINAALAGLAYAGNLDFNGADTLTVATSDATATDTDTIAITVNPVNDAPVNTVPGAQTVAEDTILPIAGVSVADSDSSALTTTLSVAHGTLNVTDGPGVTGNGTASVSITGTAAEINAALAGLAYTGNLDFNGADTLTVATSDGTATDTDTIAITVNPVNDTPALNLDFDSSTIGGVDYLTVFTDGGPAVAVVDTDVLITDSDDTELTSATVTLTNPDTDDVLLFNGTPPLGITASLYDPLTGILTLTGTASLAAYQTALRQITFDNTGTNPSTETRIIDVVVNDGTVASNLAHAIIEVTQVDNIAPVVNLDADDSTVVGTSFRATFTEGGAPIPIADIDTLITDADSTTLASATITLTDPQIGDLLTATLPLPGGITASAYDPVTGTLTLSNVASLADYETALEAIRFSAAGENPVAGSRFVEVVVNDGANNSQAATALLTVVAVNDAPALVVADASYQENASRYCSRPQPTSPTPTITELNFAVVTDHRRVVSR